MSYNQCGILNVAMRSKYLRKVMGYLQDAEIYFFGKCNYIVKNNIKVVDHDFYPEDVVKKNNKFKGIVSSYIVNNYILNTFYHEYDNVMKKTIVKNNLKYIDWNYLSRKNVLSKIDVDVYEEYLNWDLISQFYKMNFQFIMDHKERLKWIFLKRNKYLSHSLMKELKIHFVNNDKLDRMKSKKYQSYYFKSNKKIRKFRLKQRNLF